MTCPDCAEEVARADADCPHCGRRLHPPRVSSASISPLVILAILLVPVGLVLLVAGIGFYRWTRIVERREHRPPPGSIKTPLTADRAAHGPAVLIRRGPAPQAHEPLERPSGVHETTYRSGDLALGAWITPDPGDGKRHPAVVFLHGGFAFGRGDWDDTAALRRAGYVVMAPRLRGENGGPGVFELFFGEVDDALAAGRALAALPYVDPQRVFVVGHSVGGTLAILASLGPGPFRASASLSAGPHFGIWLEGQRELAPFDLDDMEQIRLRDARTYVEHLAIPLRVIIERDNHPDHLFANETFVTAATEAGGTCELRRVDGNHRTMVAPGMREVVAWFNQHGKP